MPNTQHRGVRKDPPRTVSHTVAHTLSPLPLLTATPPFNYLPSHQDIPDKAKYIADLDIECDHGHTAVVVLDNEASTTTTTTTTKKSATKPNIKVTTKASTKAVSAECKDKTSQCSNWAVQGLCAEEAQKVYMTQNCPTACGVSGCGGQSTSPLAHQPTSSHHLFLVCHRISHHEVTRIHI